MNKIEFFISLLKYSIRNPYGGLQLFQSRYQVWKDSRRRFVNQFKNTKSEIHDVLHHFFPKNNHDMDESKQSLIQLQAHMVDFFGKIEKEEYPSKLKPYPLLYGLDIDSVVLLYHLCKIIKPEKIVETGVAYGISSSYILQALDENNKCTLYSIDYVFRPWESKKMIGIVIPNNLRKRWNFIYGSSSQKLKTLLTSIGMVDIFIHDSLHTYSSMMYEFNTAWPFLNKGGFLISDDISSNNAFNDFCSRMNLDPVILSQKNKNNSFLGIVQKL